MTTSADFKNQDASARRLIWAVIAVGLTAGGIMLAVFGISIHQAHSNQGTITAVDVAWDRLLLNINEMLADCQQRLPVLLSGRPPDEKVREVTASLKSLNRMASDVIRTKETWQSFDELYLALQNIKGSEAHARQWLDQYLALESTAGATNQRVADAVNQLRNALDSAAGRERLQTAVRLRQLRTGGTVADRREFEALAQASVGSDQLSLAQKELADLLLMIEHMKDAESIDALTDLKDNLFHPALARLRRELSLIPTSADPATRSTLPQLDVLISAVFGDGAILDGKQQVLVPGTNGLFQDCLLRLQLTKQRKELQQTAQAELTAAENAKIQLSKLVGEKTQLLAASSTQGFERAWWFTLAIALVCALFFLLLSLKTARTLQGLVLEIVEATNTARASEQRVQQVINASLDGVITMDERGMISGWNTRAEQILGWKADETVGRPAGDLLFPQPFRNEFLRWVREFLDTGQQTAFHQRIEARAVHRLGWEILVDLAVVPLSVGDHCEFNVFLQDITQRKQNEYAVSRVLAEAPSVSEAVRRILAEICVMHHWVFGALWLVDPKTDVITCFDTWRSPQSNCSKFEAVTRQSTFPRGVGLPGRAWLEGHSICISDLTQTDALSTGRLDALGELRGAIAFPMVIGSDVLGVLEVFSSTAREANDEMLMTLGTVCSRLGHFIQREQADQALRRQEGKIRGILEAIPDVVLQLSPEKTILELRVPATEADLYPVAHMLGKTLQEALPPNAAELIAKCVDTATRTGSVQTVEFFLADGKDKTRDYEARIAPMEGSSCLMLAQDVSERKLLQCQLAQAQKLESIGQLAAGIAHEINTPIQYIGDNTRFLQDSFAHVNRLLADYAELLGAAQTEPPTSERLAAAQAEFQRADVPFLIQEIPAAIDQSLDGVDRVATIVRAMKNFSHPERNQKQLTDLNQCIENTILVARNEWKYVADLTTEFDPHLPMVSCLTGEFNQVILNLIVNAAHAIADVVARENSHKGVITITTRGEGDWVEIRVRDSGSGIPEAVRGRIFDPFFTTKEVGRGTGQGLAIAYSVIVDKHGGTISFETELGRGTTFIIRLPVADETAGNESLQVVEASI